MAIILVVEIDPLHRLISVRTCLLQILPEGGHIQHTSAVCNDLTLLIELCSRMEAVISRVIFEILQPADRVSLLIGYRIAVARENDRDAGIIHELQIDLIQCAVDAGLKDIHDIIFHSWQNDLCLRITEARIVLQNLRSVLRQHQTEEDHALERTSFCLHGIYCRLEDILLAKIIDLFCIERRRREIAHAARVQALISVFCPLMVLRRSHGLHNIAVNKGENGHLAASHKLLDHELVARRSEFLIHHEFLYTGFCLRQILTDQNALAECQSGRLQNDRELCLRAKVLERGIRAVENFVICRRDVVFLHQILGKCLGALEDRCIFSRSEDAESLGLESVHNTADKRIVHTDNCQINGIVLCKRNEFIKLHGADIHTFRQLGNTRIAGCTVDLVYLRTLRYLPNDGVLTSAAADNQNFHTHDAPPLSNFSERVIADLHFTVFH